MEQMTGIDRMFLGLESSKTPMDGVAIFVLDPSTSPDRHDFERVRAELAVRVPRIPVLVNRPVTVPFSAGPERWIVDPDFSLDNHVHRVGAPAPGDLAALTELVLALCRTPLDRGRPLWNLWYIEGLADGGAAVLLDIHHALLDGQGAMQMFAELFDDEPLPFTAPQAPESRLVEPAPNGLELLIRSLPGQAVLPLRLAESALPLLQKALPSPLSLLRSGSKGHPESRRAPADSDSSSLTPHTIFNHPTTDAKRSLALLSLPLADVLKVKDAFGVTVNDVVVTIVNGAVCDYLRERGELPTRPLRVLCPVNVRDDSAASGSSNHFAFMMVPIPTGLQDPVELLGSIAESTSAALRRNEPATTPKSSPRTGAVQALKLIDAIPSSSWALAGALMRTPAITALPVIANLVTSNIRGPVAPMYLAGARITHLYGRTMVGAGVGMFVHCISYDGNLDFGFTAIRDLVPDPETLAAGTRAQLQALLDAKP